MLLLKKSLLFFCLFFMTLILADAQVFKGQIIGGVNLSQVDGDQQVGYRQVGAHAGIGVMFPFSFKKGQEYKPWSFSMEILLNQKGARKKNYYYSAQDTVSNLSKGKFEYLLRLNYVSIPILLHYTDRERWSFGIGFAYNRMFSSKEQEYDVQQTYDTVKQLSPNDFTVMADIRIRIWQQLKFGFRFEYSMVPLRTRSYPRTIYTPAETRKQYNNSLTFYLVYMLNEKRTEQVKKKKEIEKPYYY